MNKIKIKSNYNYIKKIKINNNDIYFENNPLYIFNNDELVLHYNLYYSLKFPVTPVINNILEYCLKNIIIQNGLFLEFGVYKGYTINIISNYCNNVYGFDTFTGLPEKWRNNFDAGTFNLNGKLPNVNDNVTLISGLYQDTLPSFIKKFKKTPISFLHLDSDLYSSTIFVLDTLINNLVPGTIILFDELINYNEFLNGEWKALVQFFTKNTIKFKILAQSYILQDIVKNEKANNQQVAIQII